MNGILKMKKFLTLFSAILFLSGFESLSDTLSNFEIENRTPNTWEIEQSATEVKAYNHDYDFELTFYVDNFMPNSPQCLSNKRIKDIKFDVDIYKKAQAGDSNWAKMVDRMRILFTNTGFSEEKRVYGSNLLKNNTSFNIGEVVHIGTLQFLAPLTCQKVDKMTMKIIGINVRGRMLPPLEFYIKLK